MRSLHKDPVHRFAGAPEFMEALNLKRPRGQGSRSARSLNCARRTRRPHAVSETLGGSRSIPRRWKNAPNDPASIATMEIAYA
jgi:hypothetical protein